MKVGSEWATMSSVEGLVCIVTGGTSGLGLEIARALVSSGATVAVLSSSPERVAAAREEFDAPHVCGQVDVREEGQVTSFVGAIVEEFGRVDALVNAAGITIRKPSLELALDDWQRVLDVNLTGTMVTTRAVASQMHGGRWQASPRRCSVVNVGSLCANVSCLEAVAYGVSKAGVVQLTRDLANEWAHLGMRVNCVIPGVFITDLNRDRFIGTRRGQLALQRTPLSRFGDPSDLAGPVLFLISDASRYMTGATVPVDGGYLTRGLGSYGEGPDS